MKSILIILITFIAGCGTASKVTAPNPIAENNKDVLVLSILIRDHLERTNGRDTNFIALIQNDTLKRITNNFEKIELKYGGIITVRFKFSKSRNDKIVLTNAEREIFNRAIYTIKRISGEYDGEIQFWYGERFYTRKKIIVNNSSVATAK